MAIGSIVDYLKENGQDSSFSSRKKLAEEYGISGYTGTAGQNTQLLKNMQRNTKPSANVTAGQAGLNPTGGPYQAQYSQGTSATQGQTGTGGSSPYGYNRSDAVKEYANRVKDLENERPEPFESRYESDIQNILQGILNRPKFEYKAEDMVNDDLYKMYRDQYLREGNLAMRDTMGNAAALTGGYGSTYAQAAGQQAYDNHVSHLNDKALDFYDRAYNRYLNEGQDLYNQMGVVTGLDNTDYNRYRDTVGDYYNDLNYYNNRYNQEHSYDFGEYQNAQEADRWAQEFAFQKEQADQAQKNWEAQFALSQQKSGSGGGRSSSGSSKKETKEETKQEPYTYNEFRKAYLDVYQKEGKDAADKMAAYLEDAGLVDMYKKTKQDALDVIAGTEAIRNPKLTMDLFKENVLQNASNNQAVDEWRKKWSGKK